jgi:hypothetical protein
MSPSPKSSRELFGMCSRLALAEVVQWDEIPRHVELLCNAEGVEQADTPSADMPIKMRGECCGFQTASWRRRAVCPMCGDPVRDA